MGASNVADAFAAWAGRVPPLSMVVLAYMALVSVDADPEPWFGMGHDALAEFALGRPDPDESDVRAVRRAITPLLAAGAIETARKASPRRGDGGPNTVRYRLILPVDNGQRRTVSGPDVGRFVAGRRTVCGRTQDGNRPTEDKEEYEEREEEEDVALIAAVTVPRAREAAQKPSMSLRCPRHPAMPARGCPPCKAQAPRQPPLLQVVREAS